MKATLVFGVFVAIVSSLATTTHALIAPQPQPQPLQPGHAVVAVPTPPPPATLTQDLEEIYRLIPTPMIMKLLMRYLLNDAEFQTFVRVLNSHDAFMVRMRFRSQPEVIAFQSWTNAQMRLSGGPLEMEEYLEVQPFGVSRFWSGNTYGWQGFLSELSLYYPVDYIRAHIDMKVLQNGIFAQFWQRLGALKPVYERILQTPEAQRIMAQLQAGGIGFAQLDNLIRTQFNWQQVPVPAPTTAATAAPASTAAPTAAAAASSAPSAAAHVASVAV